MALLASDNFQRPNESPLSDGGNWTVQASQADLVNHQAVASTTSNACRMVWTGRVWPDDHYSQVTIGTGFNSSSFIGCDVRSAPDANTQYEFIVNPTSFILRVIVGGNPGNLQTGSGTFAVGDVLKLTAIGTQITAYQNGVQIATATDNTLTSGNAAFILADGNNPTNGSISAWSGGDFSASSGVPNSLMLMGAGT